MTKRRKFPLAAGWRRIVTPPDIQLEKMCANCGDHFRVVSARKLIAGKEDAWVVAECTCTARLYQPNRDERIAILRRYRVRLVS